MKESLASTVDQLNASKGYLRRSALTGVLTTVVGATAGLVLAPLLVRQIGLSSYGVWALLAMFSGLAGLADLGVARGTAYYIARTSRQQTAALAFYTGAVILAAVSALLVSFAALAAILGFNAISLESPAAGNTSTLIVFGLLILTFSLGINLLRVYLEAILRIHVAQILMLVFQLLNYGTVLLVSYVTPEFPALATATFSTHVAVFLLYAAVCRRVGLPRYRRTSARAIRVLLGRSTGYFVLGLMNTIALPVNRVALTILGGTSAHAIFDLGVKVAMAATAVLQAANAPLFTVLAKVSKHHTAAALRLAWQMTGGSLLLYLSGIAILYFAAPYVAQVLVPDEYGALIDVILILVAGIAFTGVGEPAMRALWAWGKERRAAQIRFLMFLVNITLLVGLSSLEASVAVSLSYAVPVFLGSLATLLNLVYLTKHQIGSARLP